MRSVPSYLTDIQWFGRALSQQEVWDITTCKSFAKGCQLRRDRSLLLKFELLGDIYSFDPANWDVYDKELQKNDSIKVQYRVCSGLGQGFIVFDREEVLILP